MVPRWVPEVVEPLLVWLPEPMVSVPVCVVVELPLVVVVGEVGSAGVPDGVGLVVLEGVCVVEGVCCPVVDCDPADDVELWP